MTDAQENAAGHERPSIVWTDPKQGGIVAVIALLASLMSSTGVELVMDRDDFMSMTDWQREKSALIETASLRHNELEQKIRDRLDETVGSKMGELRSEISRNRERLDQLIELTARLGASIDQHMRYTQGNRVHSATD